MRRFVPALLILAAVGAVVLAARHDDPDAPRQTYGDVARAECLREAGHGAQDQKDCYSRKLLIKALEMQRTR